jgi:hypothetical protein
VTEEIGDLSDGEGFDCSVGLFDAVDQIGGEGMAKGMQAFTLYSCAF